MTFHHILQYKSISSLLRGGGALVSVVRLRAVMEDRRINFGAGPAALPMAVLERIQGELLNYQGALVRYKFTCSSYNTGLQLCMLLNELRMASHNCFTTTETNKTLE